MKPIVSVIMGSDSDFETMQAAGKILHEFEIPFENKVLSAHRTPMDLEPFAKQAQANGIKTIIAGAGGAAHLPGMIAAFSLLPVIGVPITSKSLNGLDSLLSIAQMPKGVPVATMAIDGAANAALFAIRFLALEDQAIKEKLKHSIEQQAKHSRAKNQKLVKS